MEDIIGRLQACGSGLGVIGGSFRVAQAKRSDPAAMRSPELEEKISADRHSDERGAAYLGVIQHARDIAGMFGHSGGAFPGAGFSMSTQIRKDQPITRCQRLRNWHPEFVMRGKGMEKDYRRTIAEDPVDDFRVLAA